MDLHYAKHEKYEGEEEQYLTWVWNPDTHARPHEQPYGWNKVPTPKFSCGETAGSDVDQAKVEEAKAWFEISNREDLIFLEKEHVACQYWYDNEKKEIFAAQATK